MQLLLAVVLSACNSNVSPTAPACVLCPSIQRGIAFLDSQYNPAIGLLRESPGSFPNRYWLTNDNALAAYVLSELNETNQADLLKSELKRYGHETNGFIEILWGVTVDWPPAISEVVSIPYSGTEEIVNESHALYSSSGQARPRFDDWNEYANLALLGALNEYQRGNREQALATFGEAMRMFDGVGFGDNAFRISGRYETYKLALALYVGARIGTLSDQAAQLLKILRQMQMPSGGFATQYQSATVSNEDANVETTAMALLALAQYPCDEP